MKNNAKVWTALGLGVLVGGATGYYLNSDDGRQRRNKAAKAAKKQAKKVTKKMNEIVDQAKTAIHDVTEQAMEYVSNVTETTESLSDNFKKGISKAKSKAEAVEDIISQNN